MDFVPFKEPCCQAEAERVAREAGPRQPPGVQIVDTSIHCPTCHQYRKLRLMRVDWRQYGLLVMGPNERVYHRSTCPHVPKMSDAYRPGEPELLILRSTLLHENKPQPCQRCLGSLTNHYLRYTR